MKNLSETSKRIIRVICISAVVMAAGGVIAFSALESRTQFEALLFAAGVAATSLLNVGKIILLERTVKITLEMDNPESGKNYVRLQYLLRFFLTGVVLLGIGLIGYFTEYISIAIGALAGVFTMQIAIIIVRHMKQND